MEDKKLKCSFQAAEEKGVEHPKSVMTRAMDIWGLCIENGISFDRLKELAEADAERRLVVLPCKVGDTVYEVQKLRKRIQTCTVTFIRISYNSISFGCELKGAIDKYSNVYGFSDSDIGKTVFLTREEAEAVLKKMGGEKK